MFMNGGLRAAFAVSRTASLSSLVGSSTGSKFASPVLYKRLISSSTFTSSSILRPPSTPSLSHSLKTPSASRLYSTAKTSPPPGRRSFSTAVQETLYFRPATWAGLAITFACAGAAYVIMSTADFISYTNEESLRAFTPSAPKQIEVEEYINDHPLAKSLRSKSDFTESRPTLKVHEQYRNASLTSGVLAGPGKIEVPPYVWQDEGKSLVSILYLGTDLCGYPGLIHGGLLATLLDEGLARCCFPVLPNKIGVTANLTVNYRKPSPADSFVVLKAKTVKVEGRKAWVEGHIETLAKEGEEPTVLVEASALMVEPKQAKILAPLVTVP